MFHPAKIGDELETFGSDLTFLLKDNNRLQSSCSVLLGDFNAKHSKRLSTDKNNKTGITFENISSTAGDNQMINKRTHFINVSTSCTDLILASNTSYLTTAQRHKGAGLF